MGHADISKGEFSHFLPPGAWTTTENSILWLTAEFCAVLEQAGQMYPAQGSWWLQVQLRVKGIFSPYPMKHSSHLSGATRICSSNIGRGVWIRPRLFSLVPPPLPGLVYPPAFPPSTFPPLHNASTPPPCTDLTRLAWTPQIWSGIGQWETDMHPHTGLPSSWVVTDICGTPRPCTGL